MATNTKDSSHHILDRQNILSLCVRATLFNSHAPNDKENSYRSEMTSDLDQKLLDQLQMFLLPDYVMLTPAHADAKQDRDQNYEVDLTHKAVAKV